MKIVKRQIQSHLPGEDGYERPYWVVEAHDAQGLNCVGCRFYFPLGVAYVSHPESILARPILEYVFLSDAFRVDGLGRQLIAACLRFWPNVFLTDGVTKLGKALESSIKREPPKLGPNVNLVAVDLDGSSTVVHPNLKTNQRDRRRTVCHSEA